MLDEINSLNPNESNLEDFQDFDSNESPNLSQSSNLPLTRTNSDDMCYYLKPPATQLLNVRVSI